MQNTNKKAACAAILCMAMAAPLSGHAENETKVITAGTLNLRADASTSSSILGKYGWGTEVEVLGYNGNWAYVSVSGQEGYMYSQYLGNAMDNSYVRYINTNSRGLNLRTAPNGAIIGSYPRGTEVTVVGTQGEWSKVQINDQTGYMFTKWLTSSKPSSSGVNAIGSAVVNNPVSTQVLFLRSEPSVSSEAIGYYRNGKTVLLLEKLDGWYKVKVDGSIGYMMAKYLLVDSETDSQTATVYNPNGNSFVNFRSNASLNAGVISTVPVGTVIDVIEKGTDWTKTVIDGVTGYISTWFLKF